MKLDTKYSNFPVSVLGPDPERAAVQVSDGHRGLGHQLHLHRHTGHLQPPTRAFHLQLHIDITQKW